MEWDHYRGEVGQLLTESHAGRHVLILGTEMIGIWDTHEEAVAEGYRRFLGRPFLVHEIQVEEPILRGPFRGIV
jgi:hypothetical protein